MDMLNIIGSRLSASPSTAITLTGVVHSTTDPKIARSRAEHVRDYFTSIWHIPKNRITVQTQPSQVAANTDPDIVSEENRVEISSSDMSLFDPLTTVDTIRTASPPALRFYPTAVNITRAAAWSVTLKQSSKVLASWSGRDTTIPSELDYRFAPNTIPAYPGTLDVSVNVTDSLGRTASNSGTIPVRGVTMGRERANVVAGRSIERYNLIVFDRGSSVLTVHHRRLAERIKTAIKPQSSVSVIGYTDRVGDANFNQKLSEDRAEVIAKALGVGSNAEVRGIGETQDLYSNKLPEGRFFCRTVVITIETEQKAP
jgi:outer membrane protein OmpA-like peptidoglycan-associated protein